MGEHSTESRSELWITIPQAAALVGLARNTFEKSVRPDLPAGASRRRGKSIEVLASAVVAAFVQHRLDQQGRKLMKSEDAILAGDGVSSPWLEKLREHRARLAELDVLEREKTVVSCAALRALTTRLGNLLRRALERVQQTCGQEPVDILGEAIEQFEEEFIRSLNTGDEKE